MKSLNGKGEIQNKFKKVEIGSYPFFRLGKIGVSLVIRSIEKKQIDECHKQIVDFINTEINECDQGDESSKTKWGDSCKGEWVSEKIIQYINSNMRITHPYSSNKEIIKQAQDPRLQAEGKAGQSTEMGVIFLSSKNFSSEPGSEWVIGTCVKSPCVAAGNNELTSVYR